MATWTGEMVGQLIEEQSWTARAKLLERLATRFAEGSLDDTQWHAVTDTFRMALYDAEPLVRRVLAESVKSAAHLPRDILLALAQDTAAVAAPVLEHSRLLTEDDLLPIALNGSTAHRFAIAGRRLISGRVADAISLLGESAVVLRLLANDGAALPEATLHRLLDQFADQSSIADAIGRRRLLPVSVTGRVFAATHRRGRGATERPRSGSLG
jgi:uncharacterized protein (DUF2336 family)